MGEHYYYDKDGRPIDLATFDALMGDRAYRRVGWSLITSSSDPAVEYRVSTVWLGVDYNLGLAPHIVLFETMVFGGVEGRPCWRWHSEQEAKAGHAEIVTTVAATVADAQVTAGTD